MNSLHGNYTEKSIELIGRGLLVKRGVMDKFCGPRGKVFFFNIKFVCLFLILTKFIKHKRTIFHIQSVP